MRGEHFLANINLYLYNYLNMHESKTTPPQYPSKEISLWADSEVIYSQLETAISANGLLLVCAEGAMGGRSSSISSVMRKEKVRKISETERTTIPAFYLAKGLKGLALLDEATQKKVIDLVTKFKVVVLYPSAEEIARFSPEEAEAVIQLVRALQKNNTTFFNQTTKFKTPFPDLAIITEAYSQALKKV
jgi:hypothetical protein